MRGCATVRSAGDAVANAGVHGWSARLESRKRKFVTQTDEQSVSTTASIALSSAVRRGPQRRNVFSADQGTCLGGDLDVCRTAIDFEGSDTQPVCCRRCYRRGSGFTGCCLKMSLRDPDIFVMERMKQRAPLLGDLTPMSCSLRSRGADW